MAQGKGESWIVSSCYPSDGIVLRKQLPYTYCGTLPMDYMNFFGVGDVIAKEGKALASLERKLVGDIDSMNIGCFGSI
jgi:hypothetical protein